MDLDVLIVGAGPTGLMLANQLARHGVRFMIIDRHSGPAQQTRAMAVHARTLEIYAGLGIADDALALGARGMAGNVWTGGRWAARIPIGDMGQGLSPFPFVLMLGQDDNERLLGKRLSEQGIAIAWSTELIGLEQHDACVAVTLKNPDGTGRELRAAWVAGCDGSRSAVRELNGIAFPGGAYEHTFFVADTVATGGMRANELNVYLSGNGFHLLFPMRGKDRWRVIGMLPRMLHEQAQTSFAQVAPHVRQDALGAIDFHDCHWFSTYRIHHRAAETFRKGRCFLLGDAAHIHSPMGGQGMNTGLQDAYNLAWKLAFVVKGDAAPALLDTYEQERLPVARTLLATTDRAFQLVVQDTWLARLLRTRIIGRIAAVAMRVPRIRRAAFLTLSQIGIRYRGSRLSQNLPAMPARAPLAGDRFPWLQVQFGPEGPAEDLFQKLDDTRFNLIVIGQSAASLTGGAESAGVGPLHVHQIAAGAPNDRQLARAGVPSRSFYLLRPDGHVALCGIDLDATAIRGYLADRAGIAG